jgi:hypothetical protein
LGVALEIKAPNPFPVDHDHTLIFLGGSIEQDVAKPWQRQVVSMFKKEPDSVVLLNPRRDSWDSTWKNVASNKPFKQQVNWELDALEASNAILMYCDPATMSPISLLETGLFARTGQLYVVCPKGFWCKGNVDIVCERYGIKQFSSITAAVKKIKEIHL